MTNFLYIVGFLFVIELLSAMLFLLRFYSSEGMILLNSILLSAVSIICVIEITIFSHKFRTVLQTLGAINQVSTESQVKRIAWITVTGNLFFFTRAFIELIFACLMLMYWHRHGTVQRAFSHPLWDTYMCLKHWSEVIILSLMIYILQSRFSTSSGGEVRAGEDGYQEVPTEEEEEGDDEPKVSSGNIVV